jgi:hypothetical protein
MKINFAELNTIITFLGMLAATVQGVTGFYAGYIKKRAVLLKTNSALSQAHSTFGSMATILYLLGLFAGVNGLIGALTVNQPPLELQSPSFNIHTWGSFPVLAVWVWKTWLSYFNKRQLYAKLKWLGIAMFLAWSYNWITAAISYYVRTMPPNKQHPDPNFLFPYRLLGVQLALPFALGGLIGWLVCRRAAQQELAAAAKRAK